MFKLIVAIAVAAGGLTTCCVAATTAPSKEEEFRKNHAEQIESSRKQFLERINTLKKRRDDSIAAAEKVLRQKTAEASDAYAMAAQKAVNAYADARKVAIAAAVAGYDQMIQRTGRKDAEKIEALKDAKKRFIADSRRDNDQAGVDAAALSGISVAGDGGNERANLGRGAVIADHIIATVDDFIVDVYQNGKKVRDDRRKLLDEMYGATIERIDIDVRQGDWIVFNVANNRLRWGGAACFIAAGLMGEDKPPVFVTAPDSESWSCCDDVDQVSKFIADREYLADHPAVVPPNPWGDGPGYLKRPVPNHGAAVIWGHERNTWIKFIPMKAIAVTQPTTQADATTEPSP